MRNPMYSWSEQLIIENQRVTALFSLWFVSSSKRKNTEEWEKWWILKTFGSCV